MFKAGGERAPGTVGESHLLASGLDHRVSCQGLLPMMLFPLPHICDTTGYWEEDTGFFPCWAVATELYPGWHYG